MKTKIIPLTKGFVTVVDSADFQLVGHFKWYVLKGGHHRNSSLWYARRNARNPKTGKRITLLLHHVLMGQKGIDHRDGDGLNNRRKNLRLSTPSQNQRAFARKYPRKSSRFRGVSWSSLEQKWKAKLRDVRGKEICAGTFKSEIAAAKARDAAAIVNGYSVEALNFK